MRSMSAHRGVPEVDDARWMAEAKRVGLVHEALGSLHRSPLSAQVAATRIAFLRTSDSK